MGRGRGVRGERPPNLPARPRGWTPHRASTSSSSPGDCDGAARLVPRTVAAVAISATAADAGSEAVIRSTRSTPRADRRMKPARAPGRVPCRDLAPRGAGESGSLVPPRPRSSRHSSAEVSSVTGPVSQTWNQTVTPETRARRTHGGGDAARSKRRHLPPCVVSSPLPRPASSSSTRVPARVRCDDTTTRLEMN